MQYVPGYANGLLKWKLNKKFFIIYKKKKLRSVKKCKKKKKNFKRKKKKIKKFYEFPLKEAEKKAFPSENFLESKYFLRY